MPGQHFLGKFNLPGKILRQVIRSEFLVGVCKIYNDITDIHSASINGPVQR